MATTRRQTSLGSGKDNKKPAAKSFTRSNTYTYTAPGSAKRNPKEATPASPSTSASPSPTTNHTPPSPDKPVPNYLKPTLSSRSETSTPTSSSSRYLKKRDASLNRRGSFDKPPVVQHSLVSSSPKEKLVSVRTTSFYPNTSKGGSQSARAASGERPSRAPLKSTGSVPNSQPAKAGWRSLTSPAPPNKGSAGKAPAKSSSSKKPAPSPSARAGLDDDDVLNLSNDVEEIASIGSDADLVPFDEIEKLEPYPATNSTSHERDQLKKTPDVSLALGDQLAPPPVVTRKEETVRKEGTSSELQENDKGSSGEDHQKEKATKGVDEIVRATEKGGGEGVKLAPVAVVVPVPEEGKEGEEGEKEKGKKQSPVYNDVIKEAAGKLLAKRKTKVSALVGAFETVISLQEPESS